MKQKLILLFFIFAILITSGIIIALDENNGIKEIKVLAPSDSVSLLKVEGIHKIAGYQRVILENADQKEVEFAMSMGCLMKHRLEKDASFECPKSFIPKESREARVFQIIDLEADMQIKADQVWAEGVSGAGVNVVILDTGIDNSHIELADSYLGGYDFVSNDAVPEDPHGHGTHVTGIITGNGINPTSGNYATGISPGAGVYMLRVCDSGGYCYEDDMTAAMEYAVNNIPNAKVMSISIGGAYYGDHCDSDPLAAKVNWVADNGYIVVIASGNNGKGVSTPACASKAIAVGAVNKTGDVLQWSNRGSALDIVAPGASILSAYSCLAAGDCSSYWYRKMSGTSMAAPHVSGTVALLLATKADATTSEIKNALYSTADPVALCYMCTAWSSTGSCTSGEPAPCSSDITGAGIVDAYGAYLAIKPVTPGCISDADCSDGLFCNGIETCVAEVCQPGVPISCSGSDDQCNTGVCDEATDSCVKQPKPDGISCHDGLFCTVGETCQAGVCTGGSFTKCSSDGQSCTLDSCNEELNVCEYTWPACGLSDDCCGPECSAENDPNCGSSLQVFYDSFEVSEWNGLWTEDSQNDWFRSTQRSVDGLYSAQVDGSAYNARIVSKAIDLHGKKNARVEFSWFIESTVDIGEYIEFDISTDGGKSWVKKAQIAGNVDPENQWIAKTVELTNLPSLRIRFMAKMSRDDEDANVDNVRMTAY